MNLGCSRWIEVVGGPESSGDGMAQMIAKDEQVPLVIEQVLVTKNGSPQNPIPETEQRLLGTMRSLGLFSRLESSQSNDLPDGGKAIRARVLFDEAIDPHAGAAAWKGIVIGASMFLLAPVISLEYDYATHMTLELERWDGQWKRYESQSAGTAHYHLFGATPLMLDELRGHVTESCLTALMEQLVKDTAFYQASSAPLEDRPIRSVAVKSKRRSLPAVPIANAPAR
jgi:hypothetical protein